MGRKEIPHLQREDRFIKERDLITLQAVKDGLKRSCAIDGIFLPEVKETKLPYEMIYPNIFGDSGGIVAVARERDIAFELISLFHDSKRDNKKIGLALGFPKTAVEAFGGNCIDPKLIDERYRGFFGTSKENTEEEIKLIKSWVDNAHKKSEERNNENIVKK